MGSPMLYRRDFATLGGAAFMQTPFRAPMLPRRIRTSHPGRNVLRLTNHRSATGESANSSDMIAVQPAGSPREISRPPRFEKGG